MTDGRIPLIVAITGHRNLHPEDGGETRAALRSILETLLTDYPSTPILLLSPLGEGADRLAAEVALEMGAEESTRNRVRLAAVLPWPKGICDEQWHRSGSPEQFDRLHTAAEQRIYLPLAEDVTATTVCESEDQRRKQYSEVGKYIARHCQILVALWDGNTAGSQTWEVISWQEEGLPAAFAPGLSELDEVENGPVYRLKVRREGEARPKGLLKLDCRYSPRWGAEPEKRFLPLLNSLDLFNRDCRLLESEKAQMAIEKGKGYVFNADEQAELPESIRFTLHRYGVADALSQRFQKRVNQLLLAFFALILIAAVFFESYAHLAPNRAELLGIYFFLFGAVFAGAIWSKRRQYHSRYLDYRALAEALRVQMFWSLAGIRESVADYYLRSFRSQLDWVRSAVRAWGLESGAHDGASADPDSGSIARREREFRLIQSNWVEDQLRFFKKKAPLNHKYHQRFHWVSLGFLGLSLSLGIWQFFRCCTGRVGISIDGGGHGDSVEHHIDHLTHGVIVAIVVCSVIAGLLHEFAEKRTFEKQARSYEWMESLYRNAGAALDRKMKAEAPDWEAARELVRELGREAIAENADWVIYHRDRPPVVRPH